MILTNLKYYFKKNKYSTITVLVHHYLKWLFYITNYVFYFQINELKFYFPSESIKKMPDFILKNGFMENSFAERLPGNFITGCSYA